jgi:hypothetical protein
VFDYVGTFNDPKPKHARNWMLSPVEFERRQKMRHDGVQETRDYSQAGSIYVHR